MTPICSCGKSPRIAVARLHVQTQSDIRYQSFKEYLLERTVRPPDGYVLGTEPLEIERLWRQHTLWPPAAKAAWDAAGLAPGRRVLDLGAGPGFCSLELGRAVGSNRVSQTSGPWKFRLDCFDGHQA